VQGLQASLAKAGETIAEMEEELSGAEEETANLEHDLATAQTDLAAERAKGAALTKLMADKAFVRNASVSRIIKNIREYCDYIEEPIRGRNDHDNALDRALWIASDATNLVLVMGEWREGASIAREVER
jgi:chromosome segregation ATPase